MGTMKVALLQTRVYANKEKNICEAVKRIEEVSREGADFAVLPEMFCCPYQTGLFREYGEWENGAAYKALRKAAKDNHIYVIGGSIPELDGDKVFNTTYIFDRCGRTIGKHRKMHLFDIDVKGGQSFKESDVLSFGNEVTVVDTEFCKIGVGICYDIRFPELSRLMALNGAEILVFPAAFNMTTGLAHWEISFRMRALDNQVYAIGVAPARDEEASYHSYGNSIIASPWGDVVRRMDEKVGYVIQEIELDTVHKVREELPLLKHRRTDIYTLAKSETGCFC